MSADQKQTPPAGTLAYGDAVQAVPPSAGDAEQESSSFKHSEVGGKGAIAQDPGVTRIEALCRSTA